MNVSGEFRIAIGRERVWRALHDAEVVRLCLPGCEDIQMVSDHEFAGRLMARVGAVSTTFTGRLMVGDEHFPADVEVSAHAESPSAGWADGTARVALAEVPGGTLVGYRLHVDPGGRLASVGDRLLRGVAMRMADDFFARLSEHLGAGLPPTEPQDRAEPAMEAPRRLVEPLAPTPAVAKPVPPPHGVALRMPGRWSPGQRLIIFVGWGFYAVILTGLMLGLLSRG